MKQFMLFFICLITLNSWSQTNVPPTITAIGNQYYCPLSQQFVVTDFNIVDPDNTSIDALFIQISSGYVQGEDILILTGNHPNITVEPFNVSEGKLTLRGLNAGPASYTDLISAVKEVVFQSNSPLVSGEKHFSFTIDEANYLPSTNHYYEYVPSIGITWQNAKIAAESKNHYGLQGYLATISTPEEAKLSGEQAAGAGWIGGSDAATEGVWKWVTGPENGTIFWNGGINGTTSNFAFWNTNEPNNLGDEDYAHVTAPGVGIPGSWNDLSNTGSTFGDYQPKGYIVEYGGMPGDPILTISASTLISVATISSISEGSTCGSGVVSLSASATSGTVLWYDAPSGGNFLGMGSNFTTPILTTTTTYYALASVHGCFSQNRYPVTATVNPLPTILPSFTVKNCDEDGIPDGFTGFNLNEATSFITLGNSTFAVSYHLSFAEADAGTNPINPVPFNNSTASTVFVRIENSKGCHQVSTINLQVSTTAFPLGFMEELQSCDDDAAMDGFHLYDLTQASTSIINQFPLGQNLIVHYFRNLKDAELEQNEILPQNSYINESPFSQVLYVRVESADNGDCYGIGPFLTLTVHPRPDFEVVPTDTICLNLFPITLETFNALGNYTYEWKDENGKVISTNSNAQVSSGGVYTVMATSVTNCKSFPKTVVVRESNIAAIHSDDITILDDSNNNTITINNQNNNLGIGDYEFALDTFFDSFQDEPYFEMVSPGIHTIYVRDKNNCGIAQIEVSVIGFPKFFTPNNDGYNDTWQIKGLSANFFQKATIQVFDRYGKVITTIDLTSQGWDGNFNGEALPSTDYWYAAQLTDLNGNIREKKGHFSLVRR